MAIATITTKGQTTIPAEIRALLNLHPGDRINFVIDESGRVYLQPLNIQVEELSGYLQQYVNEVVSVEQMNEVIALAAAERQT